MMTHPTWLALTLLSLIFIGPQSPSLIQVLKWTQLQQRLNNKLKFICLVRLAVQFKIIFNKNSLLNTMNDYLPVINQEPLPFTAHVISLLNIIYNFIIVDPTGNYYLPSMVTLDYDFPFFFIL